MEDGAKPLSGLEAHSQPQPRYGSSDEEEEDDIEEVTPGSYAEVSSYCTWQVYSKKDYIFVIWLYCEKLL